MEENENWSSTENSPDKYECDLEKERGIIASTVDNMTGTGIGDVYE